MYSRKLLFVALTLVTTTSFAAEMSSLRFAFGTNAPAAGWTRVAPEKFYGGTNQFGFEPGAQLAVSGSGVSSLQPFLFSVAVTEGNYRVSVELGAADEATTNTVKAESRRLMLERVVTAPGTFERQTFTVNVRTPELADGRRVKLKPRELGPPLVLHWDDKLTLEFNGARSGLASVEIIPVTNAITVFLVGDSTVTDQPNEPWNSWGQMLPRFFQPGVAVANHAESGETLKNSFNARRIEKVLSAMHPGDYLFVQFGHNDMKDRATNALANYKSNLIRLVAETRARGGTPVLVTSMERKTGVTNDTFGAYPDTVRAVAAGQGVVLIDLHAMSKRLYAAMGADLDKAFQDGTHHNAYGSYELARCVVQGVRESKLPLADHLSPDVPAFDPNQPDPVSNFDVPASPTSSGEKPDGS